MSVVEKFKGSIVDVGIGSVIEPLSRAAKYAVNSEAPNVIPGPEAIIDLLLRRLVTPDQANSALKWHGITIDGPTSDPEIGKWWRAVIDASGDQPSPDELLDWWRKGVISEDVFNRAWIRFRPWAPSVAEASLKAQWEPLSINELAELHARGWTNLDDYFDDAKIQGYRQSEASRLTRLYETRLDTGEVVELYRRGRFDRVAAELHLRRLGYPHSAQEQVLELAHPILEVGQITDLYLRGQLDRTRVQELLQQHGYNPEQVQRILDLAIEIPSTSDIINYMRRNVYDEDIVKAFNLDVEFADKFRGALPAWAAANGLGEEQLRAEWRSHWVIPSPTQLYEMYRRLRPEKYSALDPKDDKYLGVTIEDVRRALGENDILKFWRDRLVAISFHPLTRVDLRRGYNLGAITQADTLSRYRDLGYSPEDSAVLLRIADNTKSEAISRYPAVTAYRKGTASRVEAIADLKLSGVSEQDAAAALDRAALRAKWDTRARCIPALRKRFLAGEWDNNKAVAILIGHGLDVIQAQGVVDQWECAAAARPKEQPASRLVNWFVRGLIGLDDFARRLGRIGFLPDDIKRMIEEAQGKALQAGDKKRDKALRMGDAARKAAEKQRSARRRVQEGLFRKASAVAESWEVPVQFVLEDVNQQIQRLQADSGLTYDDARAVVVGALNEAKRLPRDAFEELVEVTRRALLEEEDAIQDPTS